MSTPKIKEVDGVSVYVTNPSRAGSGYDHASKAKWAGYQDLKSAVDKAAKALVATLTEERMITCRELKEVHDERIKELSQECKRERQQVRQDLLDEHRAEVEALKGRLADMLSDIRAAINRGEDPTPAVRRLKEAL